MSLPISSIVDVSVSITPAAPPKTGYGIAAIVSSELLLGNVTPTDRITYFNSLTEVAALYSIETEVYISAQTYFSQSPSPDTAAIIAQFLSPTKAILYSGTSVDNSINVWQAINDGYFSITISGVAGDVGPVDFSTALSMSDVAVQIETALQSADASSGFTVATVTFDAQANRFIFTSGDVGASITFTTAGLTGTDISPLMQTESTQGGQIDLGHGPETALDALISADQFDQNWYGILLLKTERDSQLIEDISAWAEANNKTFATVSHNPNSIVLNNEDNIIARLNGSGFTRTIANYSSKLDEYLDAAVLGKAFTVDFNAPESVITLKFKAFAGITAETLSSGQKSALDQKRGNAYITVGGADMYAEGYMSSQLFFDERHGVDWLVGELGYTAFVYLLTRTTKVPLTDAGSASTLQQIIRVLDSARRNGLIAAGNTSEGEFLANGYKVTVGSVADLSADDKQNRVAPPIIFVALLAGATHFIEIRGVLER